ncbi:ketoacyl-ACP synthase III [Robiginitalea sp. M366]|uniref:3-oxoacyl-ACP synthase III family protein n=1 Tax=Robiginitalea aestuariiviva TaxID=3036903 RepID=UPI00240D4B62|nr:ketoacyl-ACP synthase III [Robiginitalea aestuariiviva]MDG1573433.1 ketoacyl-ACP synthase III [Robiginitalea aestuariiviva]
MSTQKIHSVITGTGKYIPKRKITNADFQDTEFYTADARKLDKPGAEITQKFEEITTIAERRYVEDQWVTSDIATFAAREALEDAGADPETLDYIIVAHNFGDVQPGSTRLDIVPSLAARVKHQLGIANPATVAYDVIFGCPGWLQGVIQADYYIRSGDAQKVLVIGAETLSRVYDPHDRDGMLYADGAGATLLEARETEAPVGILAHQSRSDTLVHSGMLFMGHTFKPGEEHKDDLYLKMYGRKLYQYALENVPQAIKACLDKTGIPLSDIKKVLIHQANGKMDEAILVRLYQLYGMEPDSEEVMPMTITWLGNSSVATLPTLYDILMRGEMEGHNLQAGDTIIFASVGAGMHINAAIYRL